MKQLNFKNYDATIKDLDVNNGIVTGYFSKFGNIDRDEDVIMQGAFTKSIQERGPKSNKPEIAFLWQHDMYKPLGKLIDLREDSYGLYFEAKVSDTSYGQDALKLYRDGVITQHSIGFQVIKSIEEQTDEDREIKRIMEVKLWEGSAVTFGANPDTPFTGFKSYSVEEKEDRIKLLMKCIKNGDYTDEMFGLIEFELLKLVTENNKSVKDKEAEIITSPVINPIDQLTELKNLLKI